MIGETRQAFLSRVRSALADRGKPVELPTDLEIARVVRAAQNVVEVFLQRVQEAKMHAYRAADETALVEQVIEVAGKVGAASVLVPQEEIPARDQIIAALRAKGMVLCDGDDRDAGFAADLGITGVTAAIAETASMVVSSGGKRRRLASLAVPYHIGIVRAEQILPDMVDWFADPRAGVAASDVLVSAPSKTADIELALVMGVHGPKEEHVIVLG